MPHTPFHPAKFRKTSSSGVALVIALGLVVLVTGLVLAFLSSASLERQLSSNSTTQARVDILAKGALAITVGDLLQEVVAGSTTTNLTVGTTNVTLYLPTTNATLVPARIGSDITLPNLVKRSANGQAFYSGAGFAAIGVVRAADSSTTNLSLNDRSVPLARWNKALLLPKSNPSQSSDLTPISTFIAPDWIYLGRDGTHPTAVSTNIVGRYAYAIYDEGGLLDANVAGYPSTLSPALAAHKLGAGTADLTQIGLTTAESDALVGWRNYASAQAGGSFPSYTFSAQGTNYFNALMGNATGFLSVGAALFNNQSDRMMGSRQQLIQFLQQGVATSNTERASVQNALQYLGTFSRDINQPSFIPNPNRPTVVGPYKAATTGATFAATAGGNNACGLDNSVNPSFLATRAATVFTRNDGSKSVIGEPLVKKRFALNRLAWITYAGPITTDGVNFNSSLPANYITTLEQTYGLSQALLLQGTPANILAYFGLTWNTAASTPTGGTAPAWVYGHSTPQTTLDTLAQVSGREPDFFELLKAGMVVGSLAKGAASDHNSGYSGAYNPVDVDAYEYNYDTSVDNQIIQIGLNIINACALDSYPRHAVFNALDFYGATNLPYLYGAHVVGVPLSLTAKVTAGGSGRGVMLLLPEVWNPYDPSSPQGSVGPTKFRFILTGSPATGYVTSAEATCRGYSSNGNELTNVLPLQSTASGASAAGTADQAQLDPYPFTSQKAGLTELDFGITASGLAAYQQPVFLGNVSTAAGSAQAASINLTVPATTNTLRTSLMTSSFVNSSGWVIDMVSKLDYCGVLLGDFPLSWNFQIPASAGSFIQSSPYPVPLSTPSSSPAVANSAYNPSTADGCRLLPSVTNSSVPNQVHYLLQYQDAGASWRTYQDNYSVIPGEVGGGGVSVLTGETSTLNNPALGCQMDISQAGSTSPKITSNDGEWFVWIDPRTSRFGPVDNMYTRSTFNSGTALNYFGLTTRPTSDYGAGTYYYTPGSGVGSAPKPSTSPNASSVGWYPGNWQQSTASTVFVPGYYAENTTGVRPSPLNNANFFTDPDGVARRGMGAYVSPSATATAGMPLATLAGAQGPSRPYLLHRPFRSVAELGYVFSGTPWRNLDFFTPESGAAPLLDLFCVSDTDDPNGLTEGKVDLNTRQPLVLQALLSGSGGQGAAYKDEVNAATSGGSSSLSSSEITAIAQALVARTTSTATATVLGQGPLSNLSELVGKFNSAVLIAGATAPHNIDGSQSYVGFSSDLTTIFNSSGTSADTATTPYIQRFKEAAIRPLAASGQTRVWNLMIDLVAQTGRYQPNETSLDRFNVDGERRYWLHVAIDRYTGQILDEQLEPVQE